MGIKNYTKAVMCITCGGYIYHEDGVDLIQAGLYVECTCDKPKEKNS
jgi:hypothetical protein